MISMPTQIGILVDVTRCTGCNQCIDACAAANQTGIDAFRIQQSPDRLSANRWSSIVESQEGAFVRKFCRHCLEPACVSVCPVGAMYLTKEGVVRYDKDKCMGCRYCMMACPYGIPRYDWDTPVPLVKKCTLCYDRLTEGKLPACVETCPEGVLTFGERSELLKIAHQRIEENPERYLAQVIGENEVGGTSVMYLSHVPLDFLGYTGKPGNQPLPDLTWQWLGKVPPIAIGVAGLMTGLVYVMGRRMQAEEARIQMTDHSKKEN